MMVAVLLFSLGADAQVIHMDSRGSEYAYIDSMPVSTLYGCYVTRMTLLVTGYTSRACSYEWHLQYPFVVDSSTTNYFDFMRGTVSLPITDTSLSIGRAYKRIWQYAADSALVNGRFLLNVNFSDK